MEKLYDINEASEILRISPNTLRKWLVQKRIQCVKLGNRVRFRKEDLEAVIVGGIK